VMVPEHLADAAREILEHSGDEMPENME
jgi:hypothetical protein